VCREALHEDESGSLRGSVLDAVSAAKRQMLADRPPNIKLGIVSPRRPGRTHARTQMRHCYIIIDMGDAMLDKDLVPTRQTVTVDLLTTFVEEFFDQNPISQLGMITTKDKRAQMLLELTGNVQRHARALESLRDVVCEGEPSVQNALIMAISRLK
jgi:transcription initiation factor TFIIH subunit 2